jgi:hypothetical protein
MSPLCGISLTPNLTGQATATSNCDTKVVITYTDAYPVTPANQYPTLLARTWIATDSCGDTKTDFQHINLIPAQLSPISPQIADTGVPLVNKKFAWTSLPEATSYRISVWPYKPDNTTRPVNPITTTTAPVTYFTYISSFSPLKVLTPMVWQVDYVTPGGTLSSPLWSFTTEDRPDFVVTAVTVPTSVLSGQQLTVSWQVQNVRSAPSNALTWCDEVWLSVHPTFATTAPAPINLGRFGNPQFPDGYVQTQTFNLDPSVFGPPQFYIYVFTDKYSYAAEYRVENNVMRSNGFDINLSPQPDLRVTSITVPTIIFSGTTIPVTFTVTNVGLGPTNVVSWTDAVYSSTDTIFSSAARLLTTVSINNGQLLLSGQQYPRTVQVAMQQAVFGNYTILVGTDLYNVVTEVFNEEKNVGSSHIFTVILTPPPDLIVQSVTGVPSQPVQSLQSFTISYTITNKGAGTPFETYRDDCVDVSASPVYLASDSLFKN